MAQITETLNRSIIAQIVMDDPMADPNDGERCYDYAPIGDHGIEISLFEGDFYPEDAERIEMKLRECGFYPTAVGFC